MITNHDSDAALRVGDTVCYYCSSQMALRYGVVTAIEVPVTWLWEWPEHGTVMQSRHRHADATHPLGVEINGGLTRAYFSGDKSRVEA